MKTIPTPTISYSDLQAVASGKSQGFKTYGNISVSRHLTGTGRLDYAHKESVYAYVQCKMLDGVVYSYNTPIAVAVNGRWRMLYARYSVTTTKSFNRIARLLKLPTLAEYENRSRDLHILGEEGLFENEEVTV